MNAIAAPTSRFFARLFAKISRTLEKRGAQMPSIGMLNSSPSRPTGFVSARGSALLFLAQKAYPGHGRHPDLDLERARVGAAAERPKAD
jgi:hypothetical protein